MRMRRAGGPLLLVTLITTLIPTFRAEAAAPQTAMPRVLAPPTLDGRLDDWAPTPQLVMADSDAWQPASPQFAEYQGPSDISAEVSLAWDSQCLYVAIKSRDDALVRAQSAADMFRDGSYHGDSIVLAVSGEGAAESNAIVVALLQAASLVWRAEPSARAGELRTVGRAIWARADEGGGERVTYEISIPWSELEGVKPIAGERIIFSASAFDDDGAGMKGCLERSAVVELSASTTVLAPPAPSPTARRSLPPTFPAPDVIRFDKKRFIIKGADTLLFGGAVDYTRLPREAWASTLQLARAAGMNAVSVVVPWSYHQPVREKLDLTDLRDFLAAVAAAGLQAEVSIGPFAGEWWEAGAVPGWFFALPASERPKAAADWVNAVLSVVKDQQITAGGPVVTVLLRPLPEMGGRTDAASLTNLAKAARDAGTQVPVLTANASPARDNSHSVLANLLDSVSFYTPPSFADVARRVSGLATEENGPAVASEVLGDYETPEAGRRSADTMKVALANGATAVTIGSFAGSADPQRLLAGSALPGRVVEAGGPPAPGYGEIRLLGRFVDLFGPQLARAAAADDGVHADDREVKVATRLAEKTGFVFLWNQTDSARQVRLSYHPPGTATVMTIPEAGAVALPGQSAKIIVLDAPVGQGMLRYSTSEIADLRQVGARTVLVVYGDRDTAGEIALRWPGPPLVIGEVLRQRWDEKSNTLVLDYYHTADDQCVLVDDLQILILSRERAANLADVGDEEAGVVSAGRRVLGGSLGADGLKATLLTPPGETKVTAIVPGDVTEVLVDGTPVPFAVAAPARVLTFTLSTDPWQPQAASRPIWARLLRGSDRRAAAPQVHADAVRFRPDAEAPAFAWRAAPHLDWAPEALGLTAGEFAYLRTRFDPGGRSTLSLSGAKDPTVVLVNDKLVEFADPAAPDREADLLPYLLPGENTLEIIVHLPPRRLGVAGLRGPTTQLPAVKLRGLADEVRFDAWEVATGLGGEAAGWAALALPADGWSRIRLAPWREQGKRLADVVGVGWYRIPFSLPPLDGWEATYQLQVKVIGSGELYLNGERVAVIPTSGTYRLPLPASPLVADEDNVLAVALCDPSGKAGLQDVTVLMDPAQMACEREIEIRF
jgi:hypothetical protein